MRDRAGSAEEDGSRLALDVEEIVTRPPIAVGRPSDVGDNVAEAVGQAEAKGETLAPSTESLDQVHGGLRGTRSVQRHFG